jgi:hypothetical protein
LIIRRLLFEAVAGLLIPLLASLIALGVLFCFGESDLPVQILALSKPCLLRSPPICRFLARIELAQDQNYDRGCDRHRFSSPQTPRFDQIEPVTCRGGAPRFAVCGFLLKIPKKDLDDAAKRRQFRLATLVLAPTSASSGANLLPRGPTHLPNKKDALIVAAHLMLHF